MIHKKTSCLRASESLLSGVPNIESFAASPNSKPATSKFPDIGKPSLKNNPSAGFSSATKTRNTGSNQTLCIDKTFRQPNRHYKVSESLKAISQPNLHSYLMQPKMFSTYLNTSRTLFDVFARASDRVSKSHFAICGVPEIFSPS